MDIDLARQMVRVDFAVSREMQAVLQALKAGFPPDEYRELARDIAAAVDGVGTALIRKAIEAHPELEAEIDASIKTYGYYREPSPDLTDR